MSINSIIFSNQTKKIKQKFSLNTFYRDLNKKTLHNIVIESFLDYKEYKKRFHYKNLDEKASKRFFPKYSFVLKFERDIVKSLKKEINLVAKTTLYNHHFNIIRQVSIYNNRTGKLINLELIGNNGKYMRGLRSAEKYLDFSNETFLVLPYNRVTNKHLINRVSESDIGLLTYPSENRNTYLGVFDLISPCNIDKDRLNKRKKESFINENFVIDDYRLIIQNYDKKEDKKLDDLDNKLKQLEDRIEEIYNIKENDYKHLLKKVTNLLKGEL